MIAVFIGGMIGGLTRYILSKLLPALWGTWTANTLACLLLASSVAHPERHLIMGAGIAGAMSTWSTLAAELGELLKTRQYALAGAIMLALCH